ncbi:MAG: hydroxymethylglutaryl-CoA reductase [Cyclobacteriaceae bacterium]|nr:hydroxymethylglutaryl-CoA reductase [Cyclobacteriaceae bacterium]
MSKEHKSIKRIINEIEKVESIESISKNFTPLTEEELSHLDNLKYSTDPNLLGQQERISYLKNKGKSTDVITGNKQLTNPESLKGNIENYIGMAQIPIGMAGPLLVRGSEANGDFLIPLATTEGALVASYNRGMKVCRLSGGITSACLVEGVQRSPFFKFKTIANVVSFVKWVHNKIDVFTEIVKNSSSYAILNEVKTNIEGNSVILTFEYTTGDAAGQNMVTICTNEICKYILQNFEFQPIEWYIESNYSGDKKATALSFSNVRGKKVTSEIVIPRKIVTEILKTTPEKISLYWKSSTLAVTQSGSIGAQGHVANGLTALFIACGQDVACISESSIGLTRMESNSDGNLYVSLTLPSLIVGTVGGGTGLPSQLECLNMMDCAGEGKARKFAEICCAVSLAGEISIAAAMAANHFTSAHKTLGRKSSE